MRTFTAYSDWAEEEGLRLDAATYASGGLEARDQIQRRFGRPRHAQLGEVAIIRYEGRFARNYIRDESRSVPFLTASYMLLADLKGMLRLSVKLTPQLPNLLLEEGWSILSRSGTIGKVGYVRGEMVGMAASDDIIRCIPQGAVIKPGYLFAFLSGAQAQAMIRQKTYGNIIQHIEPEHIADMPVPIPNDAFQARIHGLVTRAAEARTEASRLLDAASGYYDALAGATPSSHDHAYAVGIAQSQNLDYRLDAFHHVGWASEAPLHGDSLGSFAEIAVPGRSKLVAAETGIPFFTGVDVYQIRPLSEKRIARWLPGVTEWTLQANTALIQVDGQRYGLIGRPAYVGSRLVGVAASWHMARVASDQLPRIFAFARSEAGRRAIIRQSYGTSVPSISAQLLQEVKVPALPSELANAAERALKLREQADADEDVAIREVEAWVG